MRIITKKSGKFSKHYYNSRFCEALKKTSEVGTKNNRLCYNNRLRKSINRGGFFINRGGYNNCFRKSINRGGHIVFSKADVL